MEIERPEPGDPQETFGQDVRPPAQEEQVGLSLFEPLLRELFIRKQALREWLENSRIAGVASELGSTTRQQQSTPILGDHASDLATDVLRREQTDSRLLFIISGHGAERSAY